MLRFARFARCVALPSHGHETFSAGSTASWTVDFVSQELQGLVSAWWSYEVHAVAASGGYGQTQAWLWDRRSRDRAPHAARGKVE